MSLIVGLLRVFMLIVVIAAVAQQALLYNDIVLNSNFMLYAPIQNKIVVGALWPIAVVGVAVVCLHSIFRSYK